MFLDLKHDGHLPAKTTPKELLAHLARTYAKKADPRKHMEQIKAEFSAPYDSKKPVEAYFMKLWDACCSAELLGAPFTAEQQMNKALKQFDEQYGYVAAKAEKKWNNQLESEQTWENFKVYWKDEIHQWEMTGRKGKKQAHQATEISSLAKSVTALQVETQSLKADNDALIQQLITQQLITQRRRRSDVRRRS